MSQQRLARTAGVMMILIFISRVLGFVRLRAASEVFGRTAETDAFNAAFVIPDLMYFLLVAGALSSAFIPVFTGYLAKNEEKEGWVVASTFLTATGIALVGLTILGVIFTPVLAPLVAYQFTGEQRLLLIHLMRVMFPAVFFTALSGLTAGVLNSYNHFAIPVIGPIFYNIFIILGAYLLGPRLGITGMAIGTIVGAMANFGLQLAALLLQTKYYRPTLRLSHPGMQRIIHLMLPAIIGLSITQLNQIITQNLASGLAQGSITALQLANRLMQFPLGIFAMGISQVYFPTMTRQVAQGEMDQFRNTFSRGLRAILFITIPSAVGLVVLRVPLVRFLFQAGEFTNSDTQATAYALLFYSLGLVAQSGIQILTRIFYSLQDTRTPVKVGIASVALNASLSIWLLRTTNLAHGALALAYSAAAVMNFLLYLGLLKYRLGKIDGRKLVLTIGKSSAASAFMAVGVIWANTLVSPYLPTEAALGRMLEVGILAGLGVLLYGGAAYLLRMEEAQETLGIFLRRFRPTRSRA